MNNNNPVKCPSCGQEVWLYGNQKNCPHCNAQLVAPAEPVRAELPPAGAAGAAGGTFPERMKANKALAGRTCGSCQRMIELGDDVWNCQSCQSTMHVSCHHVTGLCGNPACAESFPKKVKLTAPAMTSRPAETGPMVECKYCKESIQAMARKCRFCGEYQDESERARMAVQKKANVGGEDDDTLTVAEIIFGLLCGGIACIVAIIWIIQGKKKGWKLLGLSLISTCVNVLIRGASRH